MSANKYNPHLLVLPEDDANRQIANGFIINLNINSQAIQILPIANGWRKVVEKFTSDYAGRMRQFPKRKMVLLIDFDEREDRLRDVKTEIPDDLKERVFILGVQSEPEQLKKALKNTLTLEGIGRALAKDCSDNTNEYWGHDLLKDNQPELNRLIEDVKPFLFKP